MHNRIVTLVILFATLCAISAQAQSTSPELAFVPSHITPGYSLTETGFGSADRVTKPGNIYVIHKDGLFARTVADGASPTNIVKDGALTPVSQGYFSTNILGPAVQPKPGDRFYLHEIKVDSDAVTFILLSLDTVGRVMHGQSRQSRLRLTIKFDIPKNIVPTLTPETMHQYTDAFFLPETDPASAAPTTAAVRAPVTTPVTSTVTVQLGQTTEEVKKILGEPQKVMDMGAKQILIYKDVKVTLVDGKVTDAQ